MANELKSIYDKLIDIIETAYPRFKDPKRCVQGPILTDGMLGYEDCILIKPITSGDQLILTSGKFVRYSIELHYFKKLHVTQDEKLDDISKFAEALDMILLENKHVEGKWFMLSVSTDYEIEMPEEEKLDGFLMTLEVDQYKAE